MNYFVQNANFENTVVKERKLNFLKKHGLVEGKIVSIYNCL